MPRSSKQYFSNYDYFKYSKKLQNENSKEVLLQQIWKPDKDYCQIRAKINLLDKQLTLKKLSPSYSQKHQTFPQYVPHQIFLKLKSLKINDFQAFFSDPEGIRTPDPQIRNLLLYPAELRDLA